MKTEDERIKESFRKNFGESMDVPGFDLMWQKAEEANQKKKLLMWRIAASVVLVMTVGAVMLLNRHDDTEVIQIASWRESTRILVPSSADAQLTDLSHWTSPTGFLLPSNEQPTK